MDGEYKLSAANAKRCQGREDAGAPLRSPAAVAVRLRIELLQAVELGLYLRLDVR